MDIVVCDKICFFFFRSVIDNENNLSCKNYSVTNGTREEELSAVIEENQVGNLTSKTDVSRKSNPCSSLENSETSAQANKENDEQNSLFHDYASNTGTRKSVDVGTLFPLVSKRFLFQNDNDDACDMDLNDVSHGRNSSDSSRQSTKSNHIKKEFHERERSFSQDTMKSFQCDTCNKSFTRKWILKRHISLHDGVRPYQCQVCDKTFTQKAHLVTHQRVHSRINPFYIGLI